MQTTVQRHVQSVQQRNSNQNGCSNFVEKCLGCVGESHDHTTARVPVSRASVAEARGDEPESCAAIARNIAGLHGALSANSNAIQRFSFAVCPVLVTLQPIAAAALFVT